MAACESAFRCLPDGNWMTRVLDAWCEKCAEVRKCDVMDPGSCKCQVCGDVQVLMKPLAPGATD
jgi:hypothetical protein